MGMEVQLGGYQSTFPVSGINHNLSATCIGLNDAMAFCEGLVGDGVVMASNRVLKEVCHKALLAGPPNLVVVSSGKEGSSMGSSDNVAAEMVDMGARSFTDAVAGLRLGTPIAGSMDHILCMIIYISLNSII